MLVSMGPLLPWPGAVALSSGGPGVAWGGGQPRAGLLVAGSCSESQGKAWGGEWTDAQ